MASYREMYVKVFQSQTKAIEELEGVAVQLRATTDALKEAQQEVEGIYMDGDAPVLELLRREKQKQDGDGQDESE